MAIDAANPKDRLGMLKPDLALLPPAGSIEQARAQQDGARKYGAYNWRLNNVKAMIYISAAMRHLMCFLDGEDYSRDSTYIVLNDDPDRVWRMVYQVGVSLPAHDGIEEQMAWPTPDALMAAQFVTIVPDGGGFHEHVPRGKYTIVQMPVHHLGHFMACAAIVLDARANGALIDDRPTKGAANDLIAQYTLTKLPALPERDVDAIAEAVEDEFHAEGTDATWLEEAKRATAADALANHDRLVAAWGVSPNEEGSKRIAASRDLILNMVNGVFPAREPVPAGVDWDPQGNDTMGVDIRRTSEMVFPPDDAGSGP